MHLEGSLTPELLFKLSLKNGIKLPEKNNIYVSVDTYSAYLSRGDAFDDLESFLSLYYIGMSVLQTEQDFYDLAMGYFHRAAKDNVHHAEVFFDPQAHTSRGVAFELILAGFKSACNDARISLGLTSELIMCFLRHLPASEAVEHYTMARTHILNGSISGIGLDSSEKDYPPELFQNVYALAMEDEIRRTAHAGEEAGPESVLGALDILDVHRIDHGRTIPRDAELLSRIAQSKTLITLCPLSNLRLRGVQSVQDLPIRQFLDAGVKFSLNSDDPAYFGGFILDNYCAVQEAFDLTVSDWKYICEAAIEGSWCDDSRKTILLQHLGDVVDEFSSRSQNTKEV